MAVLGNLIEQVRGVSYKPEDLHGTLNDSSITLLRANNIQDGKLNFDDVVYVDKKKVFEKQILKAGDILICASSGSKELVGKAAYVECDLPMTFGAFCKVVRPKLECPQYIGHFFNSPYYRERIANSAAGANINNIRNEHIDVLEIVWPSLEEQHRAAQVLDKVSELITLRKEQLAKLDSLIKSRFIELFGDTPDGEKVAMADICRIITDGTHQPPKFVSEGIPFLFVSNIVTNEIRYDAQKFISEETYAELIKRTPIAIGDILLSTVGSYGHPAIVKTEKPFCFNATSPILSQMQT